MWLHHSFRFFWLSFASVVVAIAVVLSAARMLLPTMSDYRQQIERTASQFVDGSVRIGSLNASWSGLSPVLELKAVEIGSDKLPGNSLQVEEVRVVLDILGSIADRDWRTAGIQVVGFEYDLHTEPVETEIPEALVWLLKQPSIEFQKLRLRWSDPRIGVAPLLFDELKIQLVNEDKRHQILVEGDLPSSFGNTVKVAGDFSGAANAPGSWDGDLYLNAEALKLSAIQQWVPPSALTLDIDGRVDLELWAGLQDHVLTWGNGSLSAYQLSVTRQEQDAYHYTAGQLSSRFQWKRSASGWLAQLDEFSIERDQAVVWSTTQLNLGIEWTSGLHLQGSANHFSATEARRLLPLLPWVNDDARLMLDRVNPAGVLSDVEFELGFSDATAPRFSGKAKFNNLSVKASADLPGISGLSGAVEGNLQGGTLLIDSKQAVLAYPKLFPAEFELKQLNGVVRWQRFQDLFRIESSRMFVGSNDFDATVSLQLDWPYQQASPWIDLQVLMPEVSISRVRNYLPSGIMPAAGMRWLNRALVSGDAHNLRFLLQGRLDQVPFDNGEGRLEARFDFDNTLLDYHAAWGKLEALSGSALFLGRSMEITGTRGHILDSPIERVIATISDLKHPMLKINGTAGGTLQGLLQYVVSTPLNDRFGRALKELATVGDATLQLSISVPLVRGQHKIEIEGEVTLDRNTIQVRGKTELTDVRGVLAFTQNGIKIDQAQALLFDQPVTVSVLRQGQVGDRETLVKIEGRPHLLEYIRQYGWFFTTYLEGVADWEIHLHIPDRPLPGKPNYLMQLMSDLKGVSIHLPKPMGKPAAEPREVLIEWIPGQETLFPVRVQLGNLLDMQFLLGEQFAGIRKMAVKTGGGGVGDLPEKDEIHVFGEIQQLDLDRWLGLFDTQGKVDGSVPLVVDVQIDRLAAFGHQLQDVMHINNTASAASLFKLEGKSVSGTLNWLSQSDNTSPELEVRFQRLVIFSNEAETPAEPKAEMNPHDLPELDIEIESLHRDGRDLGRWELKTKQKVDAVTFETLQIQSSAITLEGTGDWTKRADGKQTTNLNLKVSDGNLGELLKIFSKTASVKGGKLSGRLQLDWPGSPMNFSLSTSEGEVDLKIKDGKLNEVNEGAGKLLNLISLNSLQRRLSLDFSDVFKGGFSFSKMKGHFTIKDGNAFTDDFFIDGDSARIDVVGRTGLVQRDYDQLVTLTPNLSSSLPIAGAIAGGPVIGAAVLVAERLFGKQFDSMSKIRYSVSGSWADPVYRKLDRGVSKKAAEREPLIEDVE